MHTIILAGGFGTRLRPLVEDRPKPMADVEGRPFLEYLLLQLRSQGLDHVILSVGHMAEQIEEHFGDGSRLGVTIRYSRERAALGTAGALKLAESLLPGERWLVMNGDSFFDIDMRRLLQAHRATRALATLALTRMHDTIRYGSVALGSGGEILRFAEKSSAGGGGGLANGGIYVIERQLLAMIPPDQSVSLERETFPSLVGRGLHGLVLEGMFVDIGLPESLLRLRAEPAPLLRLAD